MTVDVSEMLELIGSFEGLWTLGVTEVISCIFVILIESKVLKAILCAVSARFETKSDEFDFCVGIIVDSISADRVPILTKL